MYTDKPDGIIGNEDVGQMSAWYVWSALGMYPVRPAGGMYVFGSSVFDEATISVGDGKFFKIVVKNNSAANKYIQNISLNGTSYTKCYLLHADILKGGVMNIEMGNKPSKTFGVAASSRPSGAGR